MKFRNTPITNMLKEIDEVTDNDFLEEMKEEVNNAIDKYVVDWLKTNYEVKLGDTVYDAHGDSCVLKLYKTEIDIDYVITVSYLFVDRIGSEFVTYNFPFKNKKSHEEFELQVQKIKHREEQYKVAEIKRKEINLKNEKRREKEEKEKAEKAEKVRLERIRKAEERKREKELSMTPEEREKTELKQLKSKIIQLENMIAFHENCSSLMAGGDHTLLEIANYMGITRERVRQIEQTAIKKLKHPKVSKPFKAYIEIKLQPDDAYYGGGNGSCNQIDLPDEIGVDQLIFLLPSVAHKMSKRLNGNW